MGKFDPGLAFDALNAVPGGTSMTTDRDKLAKMLWLTPMPTNAPEHYDLADAILSSDWLAEHDREVRAKAWDEGDEARAAFTRAAYDVSVPTRDALALIPQNPYREGCVRFDAPP